MTARFFHTFSGFPANPSPFGFSLCKLEGSAFQLAQNKFL